MKAARRALTGSLLLLGLLLPPLTRTASAQTVTAVPALDLNRYMGKWYELAVFPNKPEKACTSNTVALFAIGYKPNRFLVVTSCQTQNGISESRTASGKRDKAGDGRIKLSYVWPFSSKEWVLALGPDYDWALVGSPNHKLLRILSRTPTLRPELLADITAKAAAEGFNPTKLITMPQHPADSTATKPTASANH